MDNLDPPDAGTLHAVLGAARRRTLDLARDMNGERLIGPKLRIVNPPLWEIGHLGWFQEYWCLRHRAGGEPAASILGGADALYNSATVAHDSRWSLPLPDLDATLHYLRQVLELVRERIDREGAGAHLRYFVQLAAFHEEMHCEAFSYTRQTLGYPAPAAAAGGYIPGSAGALPGDVEIAGGVYELGARPEDGFVFDNEKWAHPVTVRPFRMASAPVTNAELVAFVEDAGYGRNELWSREGWQWREQERAECPVYWKRDRGTWLRRVHDRWEVLPPHQPAIHVNWFEAQAYCRWAGRRLPTEREWELAAATAPVRECRRRRYPWGNMTADASRANLHGAAAGCVDVGALPAGDSAWGCRQMLGNVWEWTESWFHPYPGFVSDPYKEYSEPWFGDHKVLRGGSFATGAGLLRNTWRNFYTPDRRDVYAGFRTCAQ